MTSTSPSETRQAPPGAPAPGAHDGTSSPPRSRLLARLDGFLSESLRRTASPSELVRYRVMTGAALFLLLSCVLYLLTVPIVPLMLSTAVAALGYLLTLILIRRASSPTGPALLLCLNLTQGLVVSIIVSGAPTGSFHAATMLLPALAVYLMGPRRGFLLTLFLFAVLGLLHPLYYNASHPGPFVLLPNHLWSLNITAALSFLGAWGLGSLHSTARDAAQASLEQTLRELRENEGRLSSLIESTDDLVISVDTEGRVLTANTAAKRVYQQRFGVELRPGAPLLGPADPALLKLWEPRLARVLQGQSLRFEEEHEEGGSRLTLDVSLNPILVEGGRVVGMTLFSRDITARRGAELRLGEMHRTLVDVSRQAGMAEIATGVLHNVGNTLNSVNISTHLLSELLRKSRVTGLAKAVNLLREHSPNLGDFLTTDPQGLKLPGYLLALSEHLLEEREAMSKEVLALSESVDHIKSIVTMQQKHARTAGSIEQLQVLRLIDEALRLHAVSLERLGISIEREYADVPPILVDRHKLLQILINLLSNARHALVDSEQPDKRLTIRIRPAANEQRLIIEVADNGMGIAPEHLERIFTQGFTTKKTGHGFGLHISALAASEMAGRLTCTSAGPGRGATFTLELPLVGEEVRS